MNKYRAIRMEIRALFHGNEIVLFPIHENGIAIAYARTYFGATVIAAKLNRAEENAHELDPTDL